MSYLNAIIFSIFIVSISTDNTDSWAVLIAGSDGYQNYRHQSDVFHAYQLLISEGFSKEKVIVFAYDDIAMNPKNPFPGQIFNSPSGKDVYEGVSIDYKGNDVTPENYISVLLGEEDKMRNVGSGRVLKSTSKDNVFLYFSDHGSVKLFVFPEHNLLTEDKLYDALKQLHERRNYNQIVFYVEACYSGSMFLRLPKEWNIWVTTAANPNQSSYATFCGLAGTVQGTMMNTCLGDEYSAAWMEDTSANKDNSVYTLFRQYENLKKRVKGSEVCYYGDSEYAKTNAIEVIFTSGTGTKWKEWEMKLEDDDESVNSINSSDNFDYNEFKVDSRDAYLYNMKYQSMISNDPWSMIDYKKELELIKRSKRIFETFREELGLKEGIINGETDFKCVEKAFQLYKDKCGFAERDIRYLNDLTNACTSKIDPIRIYETISSICQSIELQ